MSGTPMLIEWLFEPCFDCRETQDLLMVSLKGEVIELAECIRENLSARPDRITLGALGRSFDLGGKEVFLLVEAGFEHHKRVPTHIRVFCGSSREFIEKKGDDFCASIAKHGGDVTCVSHR
jgi:hypothetical protein